LDRDVDDVDEVRLNTHFESPFDVSARRVEE